jgi:hypothetical protein
MFILEHMITLYCKCPPLSNLWQGDEVTTCCVVLEQFAEIPLLIEKILVDVCLDYPLASFRRCSLRFVFDFGAKLTYTEWAPIVQSGRYAMFVDKATTGHIVRI